MISEFQDLSAKIDALAALTAELRRENAALRQSNAVLSAANLDYSNRIGEVQERVVGLLASLPVAVADAALVAFASAPVSAPATAPAPEAKAAL